MVTWSEVIDSDYLVNPTIVDSALDLFSLQCGDHLFGTGKPIGLATDRFEEGRDSLDSRQGLCMNVDVAAIPVACSYVGLPLETEFGITASELVVPPVRLDDLDVNVSVLAASFAGESVVGFGYFVFHGFIY